MQQLEKQLGRPLKAKQIAEYLGVDVKTVRQYHRQLGGIRLGRHYLFFEREVINAIQKERQVGSSSKKKRKEKGENISDKKRRNSMGKRRAKEFIRQLGEEHDLLC
jgi:DNA-directed RNA polymerase specialized sigma subunit